MMCVCALGSKRSYSISREKEGGEWGTTYSVVKQDTNASQKHSIMRMLSITWRTSVMVVQRLGRRTFDQTVAVLILHQGIMKARVGKYSLTG